MKKGIIGGLVLAFVLVWFLVGESSDRETKDEEQVTRKKAGTQTQLTNFSVGSAQLTHPAALDENNTDHRFTRFQDGVSYWHHTIKLSRELHQEGQRASRDLEIINEILSGYRLVYQENPVGTDNEEFAAALAGENPKKVVFIDPGLLVDGELMDRFGSPYVFHPLKAEVMDIRSRGRDGQLWTEDDVSLDLGNVEAELGLVDGK